MLSLEPPALEIDGFTVFRDHAAADQFYYLAPHPKVARSGGQAMFDVFAYTVDLKHSVLEGTRIPEELGAGFLTLGVSCEATDNQKQRLVDAIASRMNRDPGRVALLPVPYHSGSVRVLALDKFSAPSEAVANPASEERLNGRPTFVENILGSATPNLMGDLRSIFSLSLSQSGVAFLEGLYKSGAAPIGVVYELEYYGLRPSLDVVIHADLARIYKHFGGGLQVQYQWLKAEVGAALDYLEEKSAIRVELTSQATGEEAAKSKELALSLFKDRILQQLFQPVTPQVPPSLSTAVAGAGTGAAAAGAAAAATTSVGFSLKFQRQESLVTSSYHFSERAPEKRVHAPQAFLALLVTEAEFERRVHRIDLQHAFFETLDVLVTGPTKQELESLRIRQVEVILTYGEAGDAVLAESRALLFRPDSTGDKLFSVKRRGRRSLGFSYSLTYEFIADASVDADSLRLEFPDRRSTGRTLLVNPLRDFGVLQVEVEPGRIDGSIKQSDVQLQYGAEQGGFTATQSFRLNLRDGSAAPVRRWQVRTREQASTPYTVTSSFLFDNDESYAAPPVASTEPLLRIDSPFQHRRKLLIKPNVVSPNITQLTVEVEYEDLVGKYRRRFSEALQAPFQSRELSWPILDASRQMIRYRVTTHEPGFISDTEWEETDASSIIAGSAGSRVAVVSVHLIGGSLGDAGVDALVVKLQLIGTPADSEDTISLFFEPTDPTTQEGRLTLPPGAPFKYRFQTIAFKSGGDVATSAWKDENNKLLVISIRTL